jgi:hypothetical protein
VTSSLTSSLSMPSPPSRSIQCGLEVSTVEDFSAQHDDWPWNRRPVHPPGRGPGPHPARGERQAGCLGGAPPEKPRRACPSEHATAVRRDPGTKARRLLRSAIRRWRRDRRGPHRSGTSCLHDFTFEQRKGLGWPSPFGEGHPRGITSAGQASRRTGSRRSARPGRAGACSPAAGRPSTSPADP